MAGYYNGYTTATAMETLHGCGSSIPCMQCRLVHVLSDNTCTNLPWLESFKNVAIAYCQGHHKKLHTIDAPLIKLLQWVRTSWWIFFKMRRPSHLPCLSGYFILPTPLAPESRMYTVRNYVHSINYAYLPTLWLPAIYSGNGYSFPCELLNTVASSLLGHVPIIAFPAMNRCIQNSQ